MPTYNVIVKSDGKKYKYVVRAPDRDTAESRVKRMKAGTKEIRSQREKDKANG